ncbi:ABC transporter permease [Streptomyces sp. E11-3]|uniref:ABC transporter permease n=1 Tax=Streptomyces sp. E11-3 TaxID=3110112 RepID=UPI003980FCCB
MTAAGHGEWTKLRTLPSTWWLLLAVVALTVGASAAAVGALSTGECPSPAQCHEDTVKVSLTGAWLGQAAVTVLAVLSITGEYGTGTIRTTLTALPGRLRLLAAKAAVLAALTAAAASVGVLGSLLAGRLLLPAGGFTAENGYPPLSLTDGPTLRAAAGTVLYLTLVALLSLGVATALRDTAASVTAVLGLLYAYPLLTRMFADERWFERLDRIGPTTAGLAIQATRDLHRLPIGPWAGLAVLAGYAAGALVLGGVALKGRDA